MLIKHLFELVSQGSQATVKVIMHSFILHSQFKNSDIFSVEPQTILSQGNNINPICMLQT